MVIEFYSVNLTTAENDTTNEYTTEVSGSYGIKIWFHTMSDVYCYSKFMFIFKYNILVLELKLNHTHIYKR